MGEEFICPFPWKWSDIYHKLHADWTERADEAVPEPPHLLSPISNDQARHERWSETVAWAEEFGFEIPAISEDEKYYK
jgi:hypothetical protein